MAKIYKKSQLKLVDGMLVTKKGKVVMPHWRVIFTANELDTLLQKAVYLAGQPEAVAAPSLDGFERESLIRTDAGKFSPITPTLDAKAKETLDLMEELDGVTTAHQMNDMLKEFEVLIDFADKDYFVSDGSWDGRRFDTPFLCEDILDLDREDILNAIGIINGLTVDTEDGKLVFRTTD